MKSKGEVMGSIKTSASPRQGQMAAAALPSKGKYSVPCDRQKTKSMRSRRFADIGFPSYATSAPPLSLM